MGLFKELTDFVIEAKKREARREQQKEQQEWLEKTQNHEQYFDRYDEQPFDFFTDARERIKELKREKRHDEAEELLLWCIEFAEKRAELYDAVPPGRYYKDLAIVRRKEDDYEGEVEILERYLDAAEDDAIDSLVNRLETARSYASQE
jgi:hypothetical protein